MQCSYWVWWSDAVLRSAKRRFWILFFGDYEHQCVGNILSHQKLFFESEYGGVLYDLVLLPQIRSDQSGKVFSYQEKQPIWSVLWSACVDEIPCRVFPFRVETPSRLWQNHDVQFVVYRPQLYFLESFFSQSPDINVSNLQTMSWCKVRRFAFLLSVSWSCRSWHIVQATGKLFQQ